MSANVKPDFWSDKRVFVTGHTGFKGSWLSLWLQLLGAEVKGYSLYPPTTPSLFEEAKVANGMESENGDIRDLQALSTSMKAFRPDILIHMAAQPLVRLSYREPVETYSTNVLGTVNILEAARHCKNLKAIVNVTTDKCYENREWHWGYRENEAMGGHDPYSSSKGCAELVTAAYRSSFFDGNDNAALATARAGNVIGGGDWAADRLIPDILRAFEKREPIVVRNPKATRPWQHVLEPLSGYLILAQKLFDEGTEFAEAWNFGPLDANAQTVSEVVNYMVERWHDKISLLNDESPQPYEAQFLKLDISKAAAKLDWHPRWSLSQTLDSIIEWHLSLLNKKDMRLETIEQIRQYQI